MQMKLAWSFLAAIILFLLLIIRITYINASKGSKYKKVVLDQRVYDSRVIPFKRGDIVDSNGTKLATSERVYHLILDAKLLLEEEKCVEPTIKVLTEHFDIPETDIRTALEEKKNSHYVILKKNLTYDQSQEFNEILDDDETYPNVTGIWLEEDYKRNYPYGSLASTVIGFAGSSNQGALGIESAYNSVLNGTNGRKYGYLENTSSQDATVKAAENGKTVVTTLDVTLQKMIEDSIKEFNDAHAGEARQGEPGSKNTAVIVMDPNTGAILAMAGYPNFDLNNPEDMSSVYTEEQLSQMTDEEKSDARNLLWRNFCVSDAFEPGSTMKPFTVAAGLETGAITGNETYYCGGFLHVGDFDIKCHLTSGHGTQTVEDAVANSCNVALMHIAEAIGIEDFTKYQRIFGFGQYTGIDLPGEASTASLLYTAETMGVTDLATNSFGQSFNVSMIQLATGFCSLINGGNYYEPHVVKQVQDEDGNILETKDPVLLKKTISAETSEQVKKYMKAVVDRGTGTATAVEGYDIGGKTGTAEKLPRKNGKYILSFIGYAPQDNPEVVVYVVIDEPNVANQSQSSYVTELSQKIMAKIFPYLNITKSDVAAGTQAASGDTGSSAYQDFSTGYADTYNNADGNYADDSYDPDYADWANGDSNYD